MPERVHESLRSLTVREIAERRAELISLEIQKDEIEARIGVLARQVMYPNVWNRMKFGGTVASRRGRPRAGGTIACVQCEREFYLRPSYLKRPQQYKYCSRACFVASGAHREYGRRGGLETWRRHPNMRPARKQP